MANTRNRSDLKPAELLLRRQNEIRQTIRAESLVECLTRHSQGELLQNGNRMTASGVQAAIALLRKVIPDLQSIDQTVSGDDSRPIKITITNA